MIFIRSIRISTHKISIPDGKDNRIQNAGAAICYILELG